MFRIKRKSSIRWRIAGTYIVIVFIAMTISGVFILSQLESYNYNSTKTNLSKTAQSIMLSVPFENYSDIETNRNEIQAIIEEWRTGTEYEIFIVDKSFNIIASDNQNLIDKSALGALDEGIIVNGLSGTQSDGTDTIQDSEIPVMNMGFPIRIENNSIEAMLYLRSDLSEMYKTIGRSKIIFLESMTIALIVTFIISLIIAVSITQPINVVTNQAEKMAEGDFSRKIPVKSLDEIGRLAQMFNVLCEELDDKISQISSEKSKLETILSNMADGLIVVDTSGYIVHANPAAHAMLKLSEESIHEKTFFDEIIGESSKELKYSKIKSNLANGITGEIVNIGDVIYAAGYADFKDDEGENEGIIMLFRDITESQKVERMQTEFVANVSHELKTPITTIKSYAETLVDNNIEDQDTVNNFLKVIDAEADRMGRLVTDLLLLSRLDHKKEKLKLVETDLAEFLSQIIPKVQLTSEAKEQHLNKLYAEMVPLIVFIDRDRMEQVVLNVLSNAIKYTPNGGRIDIDLLTSEGAACIIVSDNGIGMTETEVSRMFERFYRVDKARTRAEGGTGLGMAIAKQIVESHEGKIEVKSKPGRGTTVVVKLPLSWSRGRRNIN